MDGGEGGVRGCASRTWFDFWVNIWVHLVQHWWGISSIIHPPLSDVKTRCPTPVDLIVTPSLLLPLAKEPSLGAALAGLAAPRRQ